MRRARQVAVALLVLLWPHDASAQSRSGAPQIGVLCPTTCAGSTLDSFRALADFGLREGHTITLLYREAEGRVERLQPLAADLVERKSDVLFSTWGTAAALALRQATATIPIVAGALGDPVAAGLVNSLARPGGNVTGISTLALALEGKRLELVKEIEPRIARVAVLWDPDNPYSALALHELEAAAGPLGIRLLPVRSPSDRTSRTPSRQLRRNALTRCSFPPIWCSLPNGRASLPSQLRTDCLPSIRRTNLCRSAPRRLRR